MSWSRVSLGALMAVSAALLPAAGVAAATLVLRSNGPSAGSYRPGKTLPEGGSVVLKAGDAVTVLDAGGTRVLRGPGTVPVSGSGAVSENGLRALLARNGARQSRTGATRGAGGPVHATNVWYIDASRGGTVCVVDAGTAALWRPYADVAGTLTVTRLGDARAASVTFRPGQSVSPWPVDALPLTEGGRYRIDGAGLAAPVVLRTTLLAGVPDALDGVAQALLDKGCTVQVDLLIAATTHDPGG